MARGAVQHAVGLGVNRIVVGATGSPEHSRARSRADLRMRPKRCVTSTRPPSVPWIAGGSGVDEHAAANRFAGRARQDVDAFLEGAGRITAIDRHLRHQRVREARCPSQCRAHASIRSSAPARGSTIRPVRPFDVGERMFGQLTREVCFVSSPIEERTTKPCAV